MIVVVKFESFAVAGHGREREKKRVQDYDKKKKPGSQQWREKESDSTRKEEEEEEKLTKINTNGTHPEEGLKWVENRNGWREKEKGEKINIKLNGGEGRYRK